MRRKKTKVRDLFPSLDAKTVKGHRMVALAIMRGERDPEFFRDLTPLTAENGFQFWTRLPEKAEQL